MLHVCSHDAQKKDHFHPLPLYGRQILFSEENAVNSKVTQIGVELYATLALVN